MSKIFNDDWMREYGYIHEPWCEATTGDVLKAKPSGELITVDAADRMTNVISLMKQHGISQAPVMQNGALLGVVREVDLLNHLLMADHPHTPDETIAVCISRRIKNGEFVAQGLATPMVAAGFLLAKLTHAPDLDLVSAIGQAMCAGWAPLAVATL